MIYSPRNRRGDPGLGRSSYVWRSPPWEPCSGLLGGAMAVGMGSDPLTFALPVALAASIGFMLPVATPPNAVVFADPSVTRMNMLKAGAPLDLIGIAVALAVGIGLGPIVF